MPQLLAKVHRRASTLSGHRSGHCLRKPKNPTALPIPVQCKLPGMRQADEFRSYHKIGAASFLKSRGAPKPDYSEKKSRRAINFFCSATAVFFKKSKGIINTFFYRTTRL
jgi:hypothetical protein